MLYCFNSFIKPVLLNFNKVNPFYVKNVCSVCVCLCHMPKLHDQRRQKTQYTQDSLTTAITKAAAAPT